jgi:hypothetical protein
VDNCLRRPSSKERQSSKLGTLIHNCVKIEEEKVVDGASHIDNGG